MAFSCRPARLSGFAAGGRLTSSRGASARAPSRVAPLTVEAKKKWEKLPTNNNGKVVVTPLHVHTGDTVQVVAGADKGKVGEVLKVMRKYGKVVVADVNVHTRHQKPKKEGETGQIVQMEAPIASSNVMLYSKDKGVRSRVGKKTNDQGKRVRYLIKTGEVLED